MKRSPLTALHERAGARTLSDGGAVLTYGDVPGEYEAARGACALFDASDRGRVHATGDDRAEFLHALVSNRVRGLEPGQGNPNLLLSSKGKILHAFDLAVGDGWIDLDTPGPGEDLRQRLDVYLFAEAVELADASEATAPLELCGPDAAAVAGAVLGDLPELPDHSCGEVEGPSGSVRVTPLEVAGAPGLRLDAGPEGVEGLWAALREAGARPTGLAVRDVLRVESATALWGVDVDENVYPQEARLESAFSLDKGCYIGQEVVAKIDTYGGLNKRLMSLRVSHDDPVPRGTPLRTDDEREVGLVTSWAYSFALDGGLCLGYVKRRHQDPGTSFRLGEGRAAIVEPPF